MNKKVYIIGKVTGLEREEAEILFHQRDILLKGFGFETVNPIILVPEQTSWVEAMRLCIAELIYCKYVSVLEDIRGSYGAHLELKIAMALNMPMITPENITRYAGEIANNNPSVGDLRA